mmetsp:Transcript_10455/g.17038  ORF Transcript_10455/g.17038 Transcript_10455/m.17038 type:complete len:237 (-) Transcript_10455:2339-3049(-)
MKKIGFWTPAYPLATDRFITIVCLDSHTWITGMPAIAEFLSNTALLLTVSFAPTISATSKSFISSFTSSISYTMSYGIPASARRTLSCPGMRPATGCTANLTSFPISRSFKAISASACCPWATASPYPGTMQILSASFNSETTPEVSISVCTNPSCDSVDPASVPKPPRITFAKDRFIPSHIISVRNAPLEPIRAPTTVRRGLSRIKPSAQSAHPLYEFKSVITTGMSAPPILAVI